MSKNLYCSLVQNQCSDLPFSLVQVVVLPALALATRSRDRESFNGRRRVYKTDHRGKELEQHETIWTNDRQVLPKSIMYLELFKSVLLKNLECNEDNTLKYKFILNVRQNEFTLFHWYLALQCLNIKYISDFSSKRLYWMSLNQDRIMSCAYDGTNLQHITMSDRRFGYPFSVLVFQVS